MIDEFCQLRHFLDIIAQSDTPLITHIKLVLRILNGEQRQVIALLCPIHKLFYRLCHVLHKTGWRVMVRLQCLTRDFYNPLLRKQGMVKILCLGQSVGIEEDGGIRVDQRFLCNELPVIHHTERQI